MSLTHLSKWLKSEPRVEAMARRMLALAPYGVRHLGPEFWRYYKLLEAFENKPTDEIKHYQFNKGREIVHQAYNETKFYRQKYDAVGFHPSQLSTLEDFQKIPTLTRDEIRNFSKDMIRAKFAGRKLIRGTTSGTSGFALELFYDANVQAREWASICYQWARVGYRPGDGRVELRGFFQDKRDFVYHPDHRVFRINPVLLSVQNVRKIVERIEKTGYEFLHGYPGAVWKLSRILETTGCRYRPRAILLASEAVYDWQIQKIEEFFKCPIIAHFGQAERVALGAWNHDRNYHFIAAYGLVERDPETGELIGTSLINDVMPMIRYRQGDYAGTFREANSTSKGLFPVVSEIAGRVGDLTYDENGNAVSSAIVTFPFKDLRYIRAAKLIQFSIGSFEIHFQADAGDLHSEAYLLEVAKLIESLKEVYGLQTEFKVQSSTESLLTASGKMKWIECKMPRK